MAIDKAARRAQGYRDMLIWLTPDAVVALDKLRLNHPGRSSGDVISQVLLAAAATPPAANTAFEVPTQADMASRLAELEARVVTLEQRKPRAMSRAISGAIPNESVASADDGQRITKGSSAYIKLIDMIADRISEAGEGFSRADLHRDILAAGHKAPPLARNFATFVKNNLAEAHAILAQRQAAA